MQFVSGHIIDSWDSPDWNIAFLMAVWAGKKPLLSVDTKAVTVAIIFI